MNAEQEVNKIISDINARKRREQSDVEAMTNLKGELKEKINELYDMCSKSNVEVVIELPTTAKTRNLDGSNERLRATSLCGIELIKTELL